jgi:hypothetical protein
MSKRLINIRRIKKLKHYKLFCKVNLTYYLHNNKFTVWNKILLDKLTVTQLVKKFLAFYGTRRFITVLTTARQWSLS